MSARLAALLCLVLAAAPARAEDFVAIRHLDGYPPPDVSFETTQLRVARTSAAPIKPEKQRDVDRFFARVAAILADESLKPDWQHAFPDAPYVEITIELAGKKVKWARSAPDSDEGYAAADRTEAVRRQRAAFDEILRLTIDRARDRIAP